jgi:hypothetical protein
VSGGSDVKAALTPGCSACARRQRRKASRPPVENDVFAARIGQLLAALGKRGRADGDVAVVGYLQALIEQAVTIQAGLVEDLRSGEVPASWAQIGDKLGTTRQAAQQRFGGDGARRPGGQQGCWR